MGICFGKSKRSTVEIVPHDHQPAPTAVRLYGSPTSPLTAYIRFALRHKPVSLRFLGSDSEYPIIEIGSDRVSGPRNALLQYIESRFPHPPLRIRGFRDDDDDEEALSFWEAVVKLTELQHKSITWHMERLVRWVVDLGTRGRGGGGKKGVFDPTVGSPRMEVRKLARSYSQLLEVMLEHAQMEERVLFPILNFADPGICKAANEEHARDLPIMNGIKEDIKSVGVLDNGSPAYQEALSNFSKRLKALQEHYKQHFSEEEREVLPYMEAVELSAERQQRVLDECLDVMQQSHSHLFNFLLEGLLPHEAMQYLDLISMCSNKERTTSMLQMI